MEIIQTAASVLTHRLPHSAKPPHSKMSDDIFSLVSRILPQRGIILEMKSEEKKSKGVRWIYWIAGFLMITLSLAVPFKSVLIQGVSQWEIGKAFANRMNDVAYEEYHDADGDAFENAFVANEAVGREKPLLALVEANLDAVMSSAASSSALSVTPSLPDSTPYTKAIAEETARMYQEQLGAQWKDIPDFQERLQEKAEEAADALTYYMQDISESFVGKLSVLPTAYCVLTNRYLHIIGAVLVLLLWSIGFYLNKRRTGARYAAVTCFISSMITAVLTALFFLSAYSITDSLFGRSIDFNFAAYGWTALSEFILAAVLLAVSKA